MELVPLKPEQVLPNQEALSRAYKELAEIGIGRLPSAFEFAVKLNELACAHTKKARQHTLALGPILQVMRDEQLYTHLGHGSFEEWLQQGELDLKLPYATDIINLWKIALPACERIGMSPGDFVEQVSLGKARLVLRPIRLAEEAGTPLSDEDIKDLFQLASTLRFSDLQRHIKPSGTHNPSDNNEYTGKGEETEPYIKFVVERSGNRFRIASNLLEDADMQFIEKRLRPVWVDANGELLEFKKNAS
jgi:hypothetical protein